MSSIQIRNINKKLRYCLQLHIINFTQIYLFTLHKLSIICITMITRQKHFCVDETKNLATPIIYHQMTSDRKSIENTWVHIWRSLSWNVIYHGFHLIQRVADTDTKHSRETAASFTSPHTIQINSKQFISLTQRTDRLRTMVVRDGEEHPHIALRNDKTNMLYCNIPI